MTLLELQTKIRLDGSIHSTNVTDSELIGYINDSIKIAEAEIHTLYEDYFLASKYLNHPTGTVVGTSEYGLPSDIYANKIRKVLFSDGTKEYEIIRIKNLRDLLDIEDNDDYRYLLKNDVANGTKIKLYPSAQEASTTNIDIWYIRNARQYYAFTISSVADNGSGKARFTTALPHNLETGRYVLISGTTNYNSSSIVITVIDSTRFDTAQTYVSSQTGLGYANDVLDIPEFENFIMWYTRYLCMINKDINNPMLPVVKNEVDSQRELMITTLTSMVPDEDNFVQGDLSFYNDFNNDCLI